MVLLLLAAVVPFVPFFFFSAIASAWLIAMGIPFLLIYVAATISKGVADAVFKRRVAPLLYAVLGRPQPEQPLPSPSAEHLPAAADSVLRGPLAQYRKSISVPASSDASLASSSGNDNLPPGSISLPGADPSRSLLALPTGGASLPQQWTTNSPSDLNPPLDHRHRRWSVSSTVELGRSASMLFSSGSVGNLGGLQPSRGYVPVHTPDFKPNEKRRMSEPLTGSHAYPFSPLQSPSGSLDNLRSAELRSPGEVRAKGWDMFSATTSEPVLVHGGNAMVAEPGDVGGGSGEDVAVEGGWEGSGGGLDPDSGAVSGSASAFASGYEADGTLSDVKGKGRADPPPPIDTFIPTTDPDPSEYNLDWIEDAETLQGVVGHIGEWSYSPDSAISPDYLRDYEHEDDHAGE
ncbi:hypothetical protein BDK51DRAFT_45203 [Blyttiomyces helicus]|uniref:Uncharacterized protein n=1 Tax=Blyttiomyces helicus TaxID=388810 RepID=A0A4P9W7B7_9FUNG|nr:hypothetical protein BDK51DRAFT_45203 [Blyttiomyces helicus]|eukprot:RKO87962.1 hypothetical protein BDK51DRAFT_45203 [Blyttiomyces helicus]